MKDIAVNGIVEDAFDARMAEICRDEPPPWTAHAPGHWLTNGGLEWAEAPYRLPSGCHIDFHDTVLELDTRIPDRLLGSNVPIHLIPTVIGWAQGLKGQDAVDAIPRDMQVCNVTLVFNHSKLVERARSLAASLRICGGSLQGHGAVWHNITVWDAGSWAGVNDVGIESFPLGICGALSGYDRHALYSAPEGFEHDGDLTQPRSRITSVKFDRYQTPRSNRQVSHAIIVGSFCPAEIGDPWREIGPWRHIPRRAPFIADVHGYVRDDPLADVNQCQLATIYQSIDGEIRNCSTQGYQAGVYGDYFVNDGLKVSGCDFEALRPIAQLLSPSGAGSEEYYSRGLKVLNNDLRMLPNNAPGWHGGVYLNRMGGAPARHISDTLIDGNRFSMARRTGSTDMLPPGVGNVGVSASEVTGLTVTPNNTFEGIAESARYDIRNSTGVSLPTPPGRKGCRPF